VGHTSICHKTGRTTDRETPWQIRHQRQSIAASASELIALKALHFIKYHIAELIGFCVASACGFAPGRS